MPFPIFPRASQGEMVGRLSDRTCKKSLILLVPGERIELPTNGLQNRCSTAELTRQNGYVRTGVGYLATRSRTTPYVAEISSHRRLGKAPSLRRVGDRPATRLCPRPAR